MEGFSDLVGTIAAGIRKRAKRDGYTRANMIRSLEEQLSACNRPGCNGCKVVRGLLAEFTEKQEDRERYP